jgi:hypothetical protein
VGRLLPIALLVFAVASATQAQAESLRTKGGELFCRDRSNFPEYLADRGAGHHAVKGCRQPAKGTRYEVLKEAVETGIDQVRLYDGSRPVEGYLLVQSK